MFSTHVLPLSLDVKILKFPYNPATNTSTDTPLAYWDIQWIWIIVYTWVENNNSGGFYWRRTAVSYDGSTIVAVNLWGGYIYTSHDYGVTFTAFDGAGKSDWHGVCMSADTTRLVDSVYGGYIYTSSDSGVTWTERSTSGYTTRSQVTFFSDESIIFAGNSNWWDYIKVSYDFGEHWISMTHPGTMKVLFEHRQWIIRYSAYIYQFYSLKKEKL